MNKEAHTANIHESAPQFIYNFDIGPTVVPPETFIKQVEQASKDDVLELNCQLFANVITRARGFDIPENYRSSEHYYDPQNALKDVPPELAQSGDIVGFSGHPRANPKRIHLAVVKDNTHGAIQLIHAAKELKTVGETPIEAVMSWKFHETLRFVKRPTTIYEGRQPNRTALKKLKFLT